MKNWVVKLLLLLLIPSILGVLFTVIFGSDTTVYMQLAIYICAPLLTLVLGFFFVKVKWATPLLALLVIASIAFNVPLQNWLFHSADEIVRYASVTDLYNPNHKALYFVFDTLEVDYKRKSSVTITREVTRSNGRHRFRKEKKQVHYAVAPVFKDSLPKRRYADREVKAWVVPVAHSREQAAICYERCYFDRDDYQKAIDKSPCRLHHPQAVIIKPLYSQFITRQEWKKIFFNASWIVLSVLIMLGIVLNYRVNRK